MSSPGGDDVVLLPSDPRGSPAEQFVQGLQRRALERERRNAAAAAAALEGSALGATMPLDDGELVMSMLLSVIFAEVITSIKFVCPDGKVICTAVLMYFVVYP